jgi:hypothetical protein
MHSESLRSGYDYMKGIPEVLDVGPAGPKASEPIARHTKSKVDWYYSQDLKSQRYPVKLSSQRYRLESLDDGSDLPEG